MGWIDKKGNHQRPFNASQESALKADNWAETGLDKRFDFVIDKIGELKTVQENTVDLFSRKHADTNRYGLKVIPWQQLKQYQSYLKGFYFHSTGNIKQGMKWYTHSLYVAEGKSVNYWRLQALENIEQIIAERKREGEREAQKSNKVGKGQVGKNHGSGQIVSKPSGAEKFDWKDKNAIYDMLSHHYVLRKSVVFIVDTEYSSVIYQDLASKYVQSIFKGLDGQDYFGYISIGKNSGLDLCHLEKKEKNTHLKERFISTMSKKEP